MDTNNPRRCIECGEIRYVPKDTTWVCPRCGCEQFTFKMAPVPSNIKYTEEAKEERFWQYLTNSIPDVINKVKASEKT